MPILISLKIKNIETFFILFAVIIFLIPLKANCEIAPIWGGYFKFNGKIYLAKQLNPNDHKQLINNASVGKINHELFQNDFSNLNLVPLEIRKNYFDQNGTTRILASILNRNLNAEEKNNENKLFLENCEIAEIHLKFYYVICQQCSKFEPCGNKLKNSAI